MIALFDYISGSCIIDTGFNQCYYNDDERVLSVVQNPFGTEPIYYTELPTKIAFSTELKELLQLVAYPSIEPRPLAEGLRFNFPISQEHTWIKRIKRVGSGVIVKVDKNGLQLS